MEIVAYVIIGFVLLMLVFGWIGVIWLWAGEIKSMVRRRRLGKIHCKKAPMR